MLKYSNNFGQLRRQILNNVSTYIGTCSGISCSTSSPANACVQCYGGTSGLYVKAVANPGGYTLCAGAVVWSTTSDERLQK